MCPRAYIQRICLIGVVVGFVLPIDAIRRRRLKEKQAVHTGFTLKSSAFANSGAIPTMYTCDGKDVSPPLRWKNVPAGTQSFVIICQDPDARGGTWTHWVVFNLPATVMYLPVNANIEYYKGIEGTNSWGSADWGGPCPPMRQHRYTFDIYALSTPKLRLDKKAKRPEVVRAMRGKILAKSRLMGTYQRPQKR